MAINLVEYPNTSAPVENTDWTDMYALVAANGVPQAPRLTDWASVSAAPSLAQGAFILHEGSYYQVQAADETISGSPASGINYIVMSLSGSVLSASWTNSLTGYTYDPAYGAMYNTARDMLLTEVCYLDGSDYIRGYAGGADFNSYVLSDGRVVIQTLYVESKYRMGGYFSFSTLDDSFASTLFTNAKARFSTEDGYPGNTSDRYAVKMSGYAKLTHDGGTLDDMFIPMTHAFYDQSSDIIWMYFVRIEGTALVIINAAGIVQTSPPAGYSFDGFTGVYF